MILRVPMNLESHNHWKSLAPSASTGTKPATITLPWDPRRYAVAGLEEHWDPDPDLAYLDVKLVLYTPPEARR